MEIPIQKRNSFNQIIPKSKPSNHKYSTFELSPRIVIKLVKKIVNEILMSDLFKTIIQDCIFQSKDIPKHLQIDMLNRKSLLEKMHKVIIKYNYSQSTYHFAIDLMDIIYQKGKGKITLEELAIISLFLSIKFNEDFLPIYSLKAIMNIFEPTSYYSQDHFKKLEIECLKIMNYDISIVTPYIALELILLRGVVFTLDKTNYESIKALKNTISSESRKLLELVIKNTSLYVKYNSFHIAMSIVCLTREKTNLTKWNSMFNLLYNIQEKDITALIQFIDEVSLEQYTERLRKRLQNDKRKEIKVNTSANINKITPISISTSNEHKTIESCYKKSQRSTSASLESTPSERYNIYSKIRITKSNNQSQKNKNSNPHYSKVTYKPVNSCCSIDKHKNKYHNRKNSSRIIEIGNHKPNIFQKNSLKFNRKNSVLTRSSIHMNLYNSSTSYINSTTKQRNSIQSTNSSNEKYHNRTQKINQMIIRRTQKRMSDSQEKLSQTLSLKGSFNQSLKNLNISSEYLVTKQKNKIITSYLGSINCMRKYSVKKQNKK